MPRSCGSKNGSLSRLTAVRLNANRTLLTPLVPNTLVSPTVNDCARLSMCGLTVVSTLSVFAKADGFLSRVAM